MTNATIANEVYSTHRPLRILLCDDHALVMDGIRSRLECFEHINIVGEAGNGAEALTMAGDLHPDIVLMDISMPVMNGLEAVKLIKNNPDLRNIPIIMVTSADSNDEMKEGLDAGVFYYLTKPVKEEMLFTGIEDAFATAPKVTTKELREYLANNKTEINKIVKSKANLAEDDQVFKKTGINLRSNPIITNLDDFDDIAYRGLERGVYKDQDNRLLLNEGEQVNFKVEAIDYKDLDPDNLKFAGGSDNVRPELYKFTFDANGNVITHNNIFPVTNYMREHGLKLLKCLREKNATNNLRYWKVQSRLELISNATYEFNIHGDLHQGNYKVVKEGTNYKLIIYDFGFCYQKRF